MKIQYFTVETDCPIIILTTYLNKVAIRKLFGAFEESDICIGELYIPPDGTKLTAKVLAEYVDQVILPKLEEIQPKYVVVTDANYFKKLSGEKKAAPNLGYVFTKDGFNYVYAPSPKASFYNPERTAEDIAKVVSAITSHNSNDYTPPGHNVAEQLNTYTDQNEILRNLALLHQYKELTIDTETFSLSPTKAGLGTITACWSQQYGMAIPVGNLDNLAEINPVIKEGLRFFFSTYKGKLIYHNASYDVSVLIYILFMDDIFDNVGLQKGLECLLRDFEDTKLIAFLCLNTCSRASVSLKDLAQEFAGNYAQENIIDILKVPLAELLQYNGIDGLSTWYVYNKYYPILLEENQEEIYLNLFKPAVLDIVQMQLTGIPINMQRVREVEILLKEEESVALENINGSYIIENFTQELNSEWVEKTNNTLKVKRVSLQDANQCFKPNSNLQLQKLLYEHLALPILETTDKGNPSTDGATLKALLHHTSDPDIQKLLQNILDLTAVSKIITTFIPAFLDATESKIGWHFLCGGFNIGGTVSGRLSSSNPNLQQIPAKGKYGKLIKSCVQAPPGYIFAGLDFNALEARIDALVTKDEAKLAVYIDGYDSHAYNAFHYWPHSHPDILLAPEGISCSKTIVNDVPTYFQDNSGEIQITRVEYNVAMIDLFKKMYEDLRNKSKAVTFALQYGGTAVTLVKNSGFESTEANSILANYKALYNVSEQYKQERIKQATIDGYVIAAFGMKVRAPLLKQTVLGNSKTPYEAEAEARTIGNAIMQSWCMLNMRAGIEFNALVRSSEYRYAIRPCAQIHDAQYFLIEDSVDVVMYVNEHLVNAVQWQDADEIRHDTVTLGGDLSLFFPDWSKEIVLPNNATSDQVVAIVNKHME